MFSFIKKVFVVLLNFSKYLTRNRTKCLSLKDEPCMVRPTLIYLNPVELIYYPLIISLGKYNGSCNVLSPETCVPKETKNINVTAFNMMTNKNKTKTMTKHILCDCKCSFNSLNQIKNGIKKHVSVTI